MEIREIAHLSYAGFQSQDRRELDRGPQSGRPKILSEQDNRHLNWLADTDPECTIFEITKASSAADSDQTVGKFLCSESWYVHFARKKPWLKPDQKRRRKHWCGGRRHWSKERWQNWIFNDKCEVEIAKGGQQKKVRRKAGVELAYEDHYLKPTFRFIVHFFSWIN